MADKKGFDLASILGDVSKLDTAATSAAVTPLPVEQIHANDKNFYDVSNVDTLVDAILLDGLQSPLVVNQRDEDDYVIISGHRRFKALQQIISSDAKIPDGKLFAADINGGRIPCFVNHYSSDLEAELALIRANSDTRVLTSAEIAKQAERVEMLLYGLKEQGYSFPGKMRDYIAECCKVSASKLARLKVIREKLIPEYYAEYEKGGPGAINESVAYELAQLPEYRQKMIKAEKPSMWTGAAARLSSYIDNIESIKPCKACKGDACENAGNIFHWMAASNYYEYMPCKYSKNCCCKGCDKLTTCKAACPKLADKIKDKKAAERAKKKAENAKIRDDERQKADRCEALYRRMRQAMDRGGLNEKAACEAMGRYYYEGVLDSPDKFTPSSAPIDREDMDKLCGLADACGCSTDFLLCRTDIPDPPDELTKKVDAAIKAEPETPKDSKTVQWRPVSDDPPFDVPLLTAQSTNAGTVYKAVRRLANKKYYYTQNPCKEATGLQFENWLEIPWLDGGAYTFDTPSEVAPAPGWRTGNGYPDGWLAAMVDMGSGNLLRSFVYARAGSLSFAKNGEPLGMTLAAWLPLPDYWPENKEANDGTRD